MSSPTIDLSKPFVVAVLEHCIDDTDALFFVDLSKLDQKDPEQLEYFNAVVAGMDPNEELGANGTRKNVAVNYNSSDDSWGPKVMVQAPCHVDAQSSIWEGERE